MVQEIDTLPMAMKLQQLFKHVRTNKICSLRNSNGEYTSSMDDKLQTLLYRFFPNCASLKINNNLIKDRFGTPQQVSDSECKL